VPPAERNDGDTGSTAEPVDAKAHTLCHHCGGFGAAPAPVLAVVGGVGRTATASRACGLCDDVGRLPGIVPPL